MDQIRIALVGKAGAGKDYAAQYIAAKMPTLRAAYADALKLDIGKLVDAQWDYHADSEIIAVVNTLKPYPAFRSLLQSYGETMVALEGETYWAERCKSETYGHRLNDEIIGATRLKSGEMVDRVLVAPAAIVITDCRKVPEADHARADGFTIVRIIRTDGYQADGITAENSQHRSETEQDQIETDYVIFNNGTQDFDWYLGQLIQWVANGITVVPNGVPA